MDTADFWVTFTALFGGIILFLGLTCQICVWCGETKEIRAILKARGEAERVLTFKERRVRRINRQRLRKEYVSQYWVRNGCEPFDYKVNQYLNDWEVNTENPYSEVIKKK